jgi:hypothetical protein
MAVPVTAALKIVLGHVWRVHVLGRPLEPDPIDRAAGLGQPA